MTTTAATTTSTSTVSGSAILTALGSGSGIDTSALVSQLVTANFAAKNATLSAQDTALTAQISSVSTVQSGITSFASALNTLVKGGSLVTQPTSSNSSVLTATALAGAKLAGLSATVEVTKLATPQIATSAAFTDTTKTFGTGTLTITFGTATVSNGTMTDFAATPAPLNADGTPPDPATVAGIPIKIDSDHQTLAGIAAAINASGAGVTATIVTDATGLAKLSLKGPTGTAQAFTMTGASDDDSGTLDALNVGVGESANTTIGSAAGNAQLKLNGVAVERTSNTISDLVTGVKLQLTGASVGNPVTLGSTTPADGLLQAVNDFVTTYNQFLTVLKTATDAASGPLRSDYNATGLLRSLRGLTTTTLTTGGAAGAPSNLAAIGVSTNKDGSLTVDSTKLSAALVAAPEAVEALFADGTGATGGGIGAALSAISTAAVSKTVYVNGQAETTGLTGSTALYTAKLAKVTDAEAKVTTDTAAYQTRLTAQYAASDARIAAYKASQTALQNQIDQWNKASS